MKKSIILIVMVAIFLLVGCEPDDFASTKIAKELSNEAIAPYIKENLKVKFIPTNDSNQFQIVFEGTGNQAFEALNEDERIQLFIDLYRNANGYFNNNLSGNVNCGEEYTCYLSKISISKQEQDNNYEYSIELGQGIEPKRINVNNRFISLLVREMKNERVHKPLTPTSSNTETTQTNNTQQDAPKKEINERAVFDYMENQYNVLTNMGENYIPEVHDPMVASMASDKFGISVSKAIEIYEKIALVQY